MSMLSAQCDELRQMAESVGLAMPQAATLMMEAADTILSLRDRAQDLQAENAKLRDGLADAPKCETCEAMLDCDECLRADGSHKERRRLSAENAKLREERDNYKALWEHATVTDCELRRVRAAWKEDREQNAKLRELCSKFAQVVANDDVTFRKLREIAKRELGYDFIGAYDSSLGDVDQLPLFSDRMRELGVEVDK